MRLITEKTFARETEATTCDYRGALEFSSANGYAQSEALPSLERGGENEDTRLSFYTTSKILYQTYKTDVPQERGPLCELQAWLITYFVLALLFWVCCITFNIWRALRGDRAKRLEKLYHFVSWGVPVIFASAPFSENVYGPAGPWCWVAGDVEKSAIWRFATYYIPLFICIIGLFVAYIYIFVTHRRQVQRWEGIHRMNNAADVEQRRVLMNHINSLMAYPFIYLVLSLAPFIHRVYNAVYSDPSFVLILLHVISIPLTGLINAIAFGVNKETLNRLNWADMKVAFQQHFPSWNQGMDRSMGEHQLGEPTQCTEFPGRSNTRSNTIK